MKTYNCIVPNLIEPQYITTIIAKIKSPSRSNFGEKHTIEGEHEYSTYSKRSQIAGGEIFVRFKKM